MLDTATFDHYEVLTRDDGSLFELGRGGMGITYKAFDTSLRIPVALKVINATYLKSEVAQQRFVREARSAAKLRNRHVASVFHLATKGDTWFYAMEFIDGETLGALVKRHGPVSPVLALNVTAQVARALNAAAQHGLVHRDIKPENLMLVEDDDELIAKVIDFGLAKASIAGEEEGASNLSMGGFVGTAHFASPEQWEERNIDTRSDIYSLGVTLWYMLSGQPPFFGSMPQLMRQHLSKPPPFERLERSPAAVVDLLKKMLAKDPAERFQTPGELRKAVEAALEEIANAAEPLAPTTDALASLEDTATLIPPDACSFETNTTIANRYQVAQACGETNAGRVYRAFDTTRQSAVRLIVLHPEVMGDSMALRAIERDVEKVAAVQHPNLLGVFGFETVDRGSFLVLEWTEGFSLLELLKARRELRAEEALKLLLQAAEGVDHALRLGLNGLDFGLHQIQIHFSHPIEKEKLLRASLSAWPEFALKLYPLGATRDIGSLHTWAGGKTMVGGEDLSTVAADARTEYIQALAVVAYEVLGGTISPLALRGPAGLLARYTPLSTLSEEGNEVLRRALDPARSFASAREFGAALGKLDGLPARRHEPKPAVVIPKSPATPRKLGKAKSPPKTFVRVLAAGVVVVAGIFVYVDSRDEEPGNSTATARQEPPGKAHPASGPAAQPGVLPADDAPRAASPASGPAPPTSPPAAPTPAPTREDALRAAVKAAQELDEQGDWASSIDSWLQVNRNFPESSQGKLHLDALLKLLRDRPNPISFEEFQGLHGQLTAAAQLGIPSAMLLLGNNLRKPAPKEAFGWYTKAAAKGDPAAEAALGFMLSRGEGVDQPDLAQALAHFQIAADKGDKGGKFALGECYREGLGVGKDVKRAVKLLREAADAGDTRAMTDLGDCYKHGEGVKMDMDEAFKLFAKAKELGNLNATGNLGVLYLNGQGTPANPKKAAETFLVGATAGDSFCMELYAYCLETGKGVAQNTLQAIAWYRKAAAAGNEDAVKWCMKHSILISAGE